jgi:predicted component of type VI protein secretion system
MKINLWYSKTLEQWRWTLCDDLNKSKQESGQRIFLRDAMEDIANTVEYLLNNENYD